VIYSYRKDREWLWSTNYPQVSDLKSRHLGIFDAKPQDYQALFAAWTRNQGSASPTLRQLVSQP